MKPLFQNKLLISGQTSALQPLEEVCAKKLLSAQFKGSLGDIQAKIKLTSQALA